MCRLICDDQVLTFSTDMVLSFRLRLSGRGRYRRRRLRVFKIKFGLEDLLSAGPAIYKLSGVLIRDRYSAMTAFCIYEHTHLPIAFWIFILYNTPSYAFRTCQFPAALIFSDTFAMSFSHLVAFLSRSIRKAISRHSPTVTMYCGSTYLTM